MSKEKSLPAPGTISTISVLLMSAGVSIGALYWVKLLAFLLVPDVSELLEARYILIPSVAFGVASSLLYWVWLIYLPSTLHPEIQVPHRRIDYWGAIGIALIVYVLSIGFFSYDVYPRVPHYLGGGKPEAVTLEIDNEDLPVVLQETLPDSNCRDRGDSTVCEGIHLIDARSDVVIISDKSEPPGSSVIIPSNRIRAITR